jgi:mono/diheme cytochrome c family protein
LNGSELEIRLREEAWVDISRINVQNGEANQFAVEGNIVKRDRTTSENSERTNMIPAKPSFKTLHIAAVAVAALAIAGAVFAQDPPAKKAPPAAGAKASAGSAARGKEIFDSKCSICHYADSDAKKIGPGLKGIGKRGTFTVNNNKVTDESLKTWIENGDSLMPPFKEVLEAPQIKDVVAYVRTL